MTASHPERPGPGGLEPGVGELLALRRINDELDRASEGELRKVAKDMARLVVVVYPSAMRYLAKEAAQNLSQAWAGRGPESAFQPASAAYQPEGMAGDELPD